MTRGVFQSPCLVSPTGEGQCGVLLLGLGHLYGHATVSSFLLLPHIYTASCLLHPVMLQESSRRKLHPSAVAVISGIHLRTAAWFARARPAFGLPGYTLARLPRHHSCAHAEGFMLCLGGCTAISAHSLGCVRRLITGQTWVPTAAEHDVMAGNT